MNDWSDEETDSPTYADDRNFYKLEKWTKDRTKVDRLLYAATIWKRRASCSPTLSSTGHGSG